ncbi:MAG TPA: RidA family protein [Selenomonadales bacterium]|nr:RidA family protein [Selenomonadales bacterium]
MEKIYTTAAPQAIGPYSQAVAIGNLLFISGQGGINPSNGTVVDGLEAQTEQAIKNIGAILDEAGSDLTKVIKTTCFLTDMRDFKIFNEVYEKYFTEKPARSCVAVKELPLSILCEIEAIASLE